MGPQEHRVERRLAAILAADVAGYSRLMSQDEGATLQSMTSHRGIMDRLIAEHGGRGCCHVNLEMRSSGVDSPA